MRDEVIEAMSVSMREFYGNPSSMHLPGREALSQLEQARASIAGAIGAESSNIYFTSGGTESCNWAVCSAANNKSANSSNSGFGSKGHIITSAIEHSAVLEPIKAIESSGRSVTYLMPDEHGRITAKSFSDALRDDTVFASIMLVNNQTGVINPIADYASEIKHRKLQTILHTDAIQAFGKIPFTAKSIGADLISISSHKLHGPKGVGALYVSDRIKLKPLFLGGDQENKKRAGTEPLAAAVGFGIAVTLGQDEISENLSYVKTLNEYAKRRLSEEIKDLLIIPKVSIECSSPYILCISLPGYIGEVLMNYLDAESIYVSRGSACKKGKRSHALEAMGLSDKVIDGALRISFSKYNTTEQAERFVSVLKEATARLHRK